MTVAPVLRDFFDFVDRDLRRFAVRIQHAGRIVRPVDSADGHVSDVDLVLAECRSDVANDAPACRCRKDHHRAI